VTDTQYIFIFERSEQMWFIGARQVIKSVVFMQLAITLLVVVVSFVFEGFRAAYSALIGGCISSISTLCFATRVFRKNANGHSPESDILHAFYVGEVIKFLLTGALLSGALMWSDDIVPFSLLLSYIAALLAYWLALLFTFDTSVRTL
jgi:ATP synthase protein I